MLSSSLVNCVGCFLSEPSFRGRVGARGCQCLYCGGGEGAGDSGGGGGGGGAAAVVVRDSKVHYITHAESRY